MFPFAYCYTGHLLLSTSICVYEKKESTLISFIFFLTQAMRLGNWNWLQIVTYFLPIHHLLGKLILSYIRTLVPLFILCVYVTQGLIGKRFQALPRHIHVNVMDIELSTERDWIKITIFTIFQFLDSVSMKIARAVCFFLQEGKKMQLQRKNILLQ